jgi:hypothetical protein
MQVIAVEASRKDRKMSAQWLLLYQPPAPTCTMSSEIRLCNHARSSQVWPQIASSSSLQKRVSGKVQPLRYCSPCALRGIESRPTQLRIGVCLAAHGPLLRWVIPTRAGLHSLCGETLQAGILELVDPVGGRASKTVRAAKS